MFTKEQQKVISGYSDWLKQFCGNALKQEYRKYQQKVSGRPLNIRPTRKKERGVE